MQEHKAIPILCKFCFWSSYYMHYRCRLHIADACKSAPSYGGECLFANGIVENCKDYEEG